MATALHAASLSLLVCAACAPRGGGGASHTTAAGRGFSARPSAESSASWWSRMIGTLPGTWKARTASGGTVTESFRVVSNESALVESFVTTSGRETLSVYHRDGDGLLLTHYCAQGNQPRLRVGLVTDDEIVFRFVDATNVAEGQAVLVEKVLRWRPDGLEQTESYRQPGGSLETTVLHFARSDSKAP